MYQDLSICALRQPPERQRRRVSSIRYISHGRKPSLGTRVAEPQGPTDVPQQYFSPESLASSGATSERSPLFSDTGTTATRTTRSSYAALQSHRMPKSVRDKHQQTSSDAVRATSAPETVGLGISVPGRSTSAPLHGPTLDMSNWVHMSSATPVGLGVTLDGPSPAAHAPVYTDADRASGLDHVDPNELRMYACMPKKAERHQYVNNAHDSQETNETTPLRPLSLVTKYFKHDDHEWNASPLASPTAEMFERRRQPDFSPIHSPMLAEDSFCDEEASGRISPGEIHGLHIAVPEPTASLSNAHGLSTPIGTRRLRQLQLPHMCGVDVEPRASPETSPELDSPGSAPLRSASCFRRVPFAVLHPRIPRAEPSDEGKALFWNGFISMPWYWLIGGWCTVDDGMLLAPWSTPSFSSFRHGLHPYGPPFSLSRAVPRPPPGDSDAASVHARETNVFISADEVDALDPEVFGEEHKGIKYFVQQRRSHVSTKTVPHLCNWAHVERLVLYNRVAAGLSSFFIFVCWSAGIWSIVSHF